MIIGEVFIYIKVSRAELVMLLLNVYCYEFNIVNIVI